MPWHLPNTSGGKLFRLLPRWGDKQAHQCRQVTRGHGCASLGDAGIDLGHAGLARQDADENQAIAGEEGGLAGADVTGHLRHVAGLFAQALARQLNGGRQRLGELDAFQIADFVAIDVNQIGAWLEWLQRIQRKREKAGACRAKKNATTRTERQVPPAGTIPGGSA